MRLSLARHRALTGVALGVVAAILAVIDPGAPQPAAIAAMSGVPAEPPARPDLVTDGLRANLALMMLRPDEIELQDWITASVADSLLEHRYAVGEETRVVEVRSGDTLTGLLLEAGVTPEEAEAAVAALTDVFDPRTLRAGQAVTLTFAETGRQRMLASLTFDPSVTTTLTATHLPEAGFVAEVTERPVELRPRAVAGSITSSLYADAGAAGVPDQITAAFIRALSHTVDFQRDLHDGDGFAAVYEIKTLEDGRTVGTGELLMARLDLSGRTVEMFRFEDRDGVVDYYDRSGMSARRLLLRTPIDGARMSSSYGMRRHPILGYSRMHKGVDFAAPSGTPIYAAGDGTVEVVGTRSGYGKYVRIRHSSQISTAYAHLSRFADIAEGARVRQGQLIGYVGSTGQATGPHLHYEVLVGGEQVNPMSVDLPTGRALECAERTAFLAEVARIDALLVRAGGPALVAFGVPLPPRRPPTPETEAAELPPELLAAGR